MPNAVLYELAEKYLLDTEYKKVKLIWVEAIAPGHFNTSTKQVRTLEDLPGMKFSGTQEAQLKALEKLGATPVFVPITEQYTALDRGVVDGSAEAWHGAVAFRYMELTKYRTAVGLYDAAPMIVMNLDVWNSLPPDIQQLIDETSGLKGSLKAGTMFDAVEVDSLEMIRNYDKEKGNPEVYYLPEEEKARWREAVTPLYEEFIEDREAKGLPAREFFNNMLELAAKYNK